MGSSKSDPSSGSVGMESYTIEVPCDSLNLLGKLIITAGGVVGKFVEIFNCSLLLNSSGLPKNIR